MKNILFLPSWFPNRLSPFNGDFVERHARAASLYNRITVLYIVKNTDRSPNTSANRGNDLPKYYIEEKKYNENLSSIILYYKPFSRITVIESLFAGMRYFIFLAELIR